MSRTPLPTADLGVQIGQVLHGKFRVEEILGQGGMGIVLRCTHLALDEQVAIKMLRPDVMLDEDATARFMREAQSASKLRSEHVARVSDVGTFDNGVPFMVMEYLDGHDLGALLTEQDHVAVPWATELMVQAAEGLAEAHSIGIVHRDVKPTNLFVTWRPDGTSLIKVLDFGISKSPTGADMKLTQTQSLLGTPAYMSPEQMRSARLVDARSDIWSLGSVMYELLEGRRAFEADSFSEMCVKVAVDEPAPMLNAPPELQQVVFRCLAKTPDQRYANMAELGRDLIPFTRDPGIAALLVERMSRVLGRSSGNWEGNTTGSGMRPFSATPVPGQLVVPKSGPRALTPIPGWHGKSDPSGVAWHGGSDPAMRSIVEHQRSAPVTLPVEAQRKSRAAVVIALLVAAVVAMGAVLLIVSRRPTEPAASTTATAPSLTASPAPPLVVAPAPPDANPAGSAAVPAKAEPVDPEPSPSIAPRVTRPKPTERPRANGRPAVKTAPKPSPTPKPEVKPIEVAPNVRPSKDPDPFDTPRPSPAFKPK